MAYGKSTQPPETMPEAFDNLRSDYEAARASRYRRRRTGVSPLGSGADYHYRRQADFLRLMEEARDMDRNDCVVGQTIDRAVTNIVQDGITPDPQTGDEGVDKELAARWLDWSTDPDQCDLAGEQTFADFEWLVPRAVFVDGDTLQLPTIEGSLQLVEAHRLRTPQNTKRNVVHGILLDQDRRRLEYWLTKQDVDPNRAVHKVSEIEPYPARDREGNKQVFHIYNPKRVSQTRGVTALAPIFNLLGMFEDIQFAKLVQQQVVSCFAIFRQRDAEFRFGGDNPAGAQTTDTLADGASQTLEGVEPGMQIAGQPGEKLEGFSPNVPNPEYFDHVKLILTLVGINLGLPLVLVTLDASETNFSGWRGAVNQARLGFRRNQKLLIRKHHKPIRDWKLRQWIAEDRPLRKAAERIAAAGGSIFRCRWNPPGWPYIEPFKDAKGNEARQQGRQISPRRMHAEIGHDWDEISREIVEDNSLHIRRAIEATKELNEIDDGAQVDWREVAGMQKKTSKRQNGETSETGTSKAERVEA